MEHTNSTVPISTRSAGSRGSALAGTATLVRFMLRRDRIKLPAWAGGLGLFVLYLVVALPSVASTVEEMVGATQMYADPIGRMLTGPGYGFDAPTYERFVANGYGLYFFLPTVLMSILLVTRHTRVEEQSGRAELVRANVVGRHAALSATLIVALLTNLVAGLVVFFMMVGVGGFAFSGSLLFAASIAATGLAFAGVTVITVQLSEYSRAAAGMAGGVLGAAFVLRAGGDLAQEGGNALSWFSPLAWGQQTAPFVLDRWWPLALSLGFALVTAAVGYLLADRRDLGASFVAVRPGPARARPWLGTPFGLAWRLQRAAIVGWILAVCVGGLILGAYADALLEASEDMPQAILDIVGAETMLDGYLGTLAWFVALAAAAYAVTAVQGLRTEETTGRAEPVLATPLSRAAWLGTNLLVTTAGMIMIVAVAGVTTGIGAAIVTGDAAFIAEMLAAHLNHLPAALVVLGIATLLFGSVPRAIPATWALIVYSLITGLFGPMLDLPQIFHDISPFAHTAEMPLEPFALTPVVVLTLLAALFAALGPLSLRRRGVNVT